MVANGHYQQWKEAGLYSYEALILEYLWPREKDQEENSEIVNAIT